MSVLAGALAAALGSSLSGELVLPPGATLPSAVEVRLQPAPGSPFGKAAAEVVTCPVQGARWRCATRPGVFDLEMRLAGFAPAYWWDVAVPAERDTLLGRHTLRPGASLAGWLSAADGSSPSGPCLVEARGGQAEVPLSAAVSKRGFFQIATVPPGPRVLVATCPGARTTQAMTIRPDTENLLPERLVMNGVPLEVVMKPPRDPLGRPWLLDVAHVTATRRTIATGEPLSAEGRWTRAALTAGSYQVAVRRETGGRWVGRSFDLDEKTGPLRLEAQSLKLAGSVFAAKSPLRARLVFSHDASQAQVTLESGEDGVYRGLLPWPAEAPGTGWEVEVSARTPPVSHLLEVAIAASAGDREAWLDLAVPGAAARGIVRTEDGQPQGNALVLGESLENAAQVHVATTDGTGCFELRGLAPGAYRLTAEGTHGVSEPAALRIGEDVEPEVELVLKRPKRLLQGLVQSGGAPVSGATALVWHPPGLPRGSTSTGPEGHFEVGLPADVQEIGLTVAASGYALRMVRVPVGADPLTIPLDTVSGTLVLDTPVELRHEGGDAAVLVAHNGTVEFLDVLLEWASRNGGGREGDSVVLPGMEPGAYRLCRVTPRQVPEVWAGGERDACQAGTLAPGGRLSLSLPPARLL